jgi:hypothetical protein
MLVKLNQQQINELSKPANGSGGFQSRLEKILDL